MAAPVLDIVRIVPVGKGMAGLAAERTFTSDEERALMDRGHTFFA